MSNFQRNKIRKKCLNSPYLAEKVMTNSNQMEKNVSLKKKLIVTSMAAALGLTGAPVVMAESATLEEIIVTSSIFHLLNSFQ
jgi:hypothetical protein